MSISGTHVHVLAFPLIAAMAFSANAATPRTPSSSAPTSATSAPAVAPSSMGTQVPARPGASSPIAHTADALHPVVATATPAVGSTAPAGITVDPNETAADGAQKELLSKAVSLMQARQFETAITGPIDATIASFESQYGHDAKAKYYSVRSPGEALLYMAMAAKDKQVAKALGPTWQEAYFLKGSALNSLGRYDEADKALERALVLAPMNAQSMIELAFSYEHQHKTADALDLCQSAEAMSAFSPDDLQEAEKTRALRCEGFNLTDLHRYDEATKKYEAALKLNPNDTISQHELEYIRRQASVSAQPPSS